MQTAKQRIDRLIELLDTIKAETSPISEHGDPRAISDCWNLVDEQIINIKSLCRHLAFRAWCERGDTERRSSGMKYTDILKEYDMDGFEILKEDQIK